MNSTPTRRNPPPDRKSTRLNSSHGYISYAVFCLKKKTTSASCSAAWSSRVSASQLPHRSRACATTSTSTATSCSPKTRGPPCRSTTESSGPPTQRDSVSEKKDLITHEDVVHDQN